ncbi:hypothetical protein MUK42_33935 [Musa troglodytarum]|uniref:Uncharacterized protein n=1 Tax=Musa troglodytarum TaxID=320322 RepID=A0A9E7FIL1_9LILI|nr:hypothetical protein MUK42_33935 [Musa troglodytarum]
MAMASRQLLLVLLLVAATAPLMAARPMQEDGWWKNGGLLESLPQGREPPSGPSGCTHNPKNHGGKCPH